MTNKSDVAKVIGIKGGFCHVYPDFLLFSDKPESNPNDLGKGSNEGCVMAIFVILSVVIGFNSIDQFAKSHNFWGILWLLITCFLVFCAYNGRRTQKADFIKRKDLISMKLTRYSAFYGASYVEIEYSYGSETKEMLVEFLGYVKKGDPATRHAIGILVSENWLIQEGVAKSGMPYEYYNIAFMQPLVDLCERDPLPFEGSELEEVLEVEEKMQVAFPKSYLEYLSVAGNKNLAMRDKAEFFELSKVKSRTKELRKKLMAADLDFDQTIPIVAFAFKDGKYLYFRLDGGIDPKVYEVFADENAADSTFSKSEVIAGSFSDYISGIMKQE